MAKPLTLTDADILLRELTAEPKKIGEALDKFLEMAPTVRAKFITSLPSTKGGISKPLSIAYMEDKRWLPFISYTAREGQDELAGRPTQLSKSFLRKISPKTAKEPSRWIGRFKHACSFIAGSSIAGKVMPSVVQALGGKLARQEATRTFIEKAFERDDIWVLMDLLAFHFEKLTREDFIKLSQSKHDLVRSGLARQPRLISQEVKDILVKDGSPKARAALLARPELTDMELREAARNGGVEARLEIAER